MNRQPLNISPESWNRILLGYLVPFPETDGQGHFYTLWGVPQSKTSTVLRIVRWPEPSHRSHTRQYGPADDDTKGSSQPRIFITTFISRTGKAATPLTFAPQSWNSIFLVYPISLLSLRQTTANFGSFPSHIRLQAQLTFNVPVAPTQPTVNL